MDWNDSPFSLEILDFIDLLSTMTSKNRPYPLPYDESLKEKARTLRSNPTPAEKVFWKALRQMPFYKSQTFYRQKPMGSYIVDFTATPLDS